MFSNDHVRPQTNGPPPRGKANRRPAPFHRPIAVGHRLGVSGIVPRARAEINRINPLCLPPLLHRPRQRRLGSARDLGRLMGPKPHPPRRGLPPRNRGVEIRTTFVGGSPLRQAGKLRDHRKGPTAPLARVPTDPGGQHILLGLHFHEDASPPQERRPAAGGEVTPRPVRSETSRWSPLAGEPLPRSRARPGGPGQHDHSASGLPR